MSHQSQQQSQTGTPSRREFIKGGTLAAVAGATTLGLNAGAYASGSDILKVGLVGCGGRGTGAANQALRADPQTRLVAMADTFENQLQNSLRNLKGQSEIADRVMVDKDRQYVGLKGYQAVIEQSDVVLLATPPGFRPYHLRAAVEAGKHVFTEKPMATDAPGVRSVMETVRMSREKGLAVVAGFCWRYDSPRRELFQRIHDGAIGDVHTAYGTYLTGPVKPMPKADTRPKGISDLEWMVRNWYNFAWLSGDGLVEQACHTVDWLAWAQKDTSPVACTAVGGRQIPAHGGNIFDHIEVNYEWADGTRGFLAQRQISGCYGENNLYLLGSDGQATIGRRGVTTSGKQDWRYRGPAPNMYQVEHNEMFKSIRDGKPINDGERMANSTMMAIMGRMAAYTGQQIKWEQALNSQQLLVPELNDWSDQVDVPPLAKPGITQFV